ncbi:SDR family NAD(P)-dependent oxidoreductase [Micromonospora sp. WMMA1363]|uniref:SDR family NAD(P)-dependent oxidoreductase n=1 Tax=Micromonospora sp. WMMA1363 TaxID=3053985 RepID=UPI00259C894D|nr:SDR family NAD(P)-dependent oxidoreductase [Micromonospora sp. WMMA1363]MDM4719606.1 SDR family NAD(P)-dependent oxidoreductase [Micromonospora sp. WMMA1363]
MVNSAVRDSRGTTVVITGASAGIGAAAARRFAELGATVAVVGRSPEKTAAIAAEVGGRMHLVDYGSLDDVRRLAADLLATYERIDILANNAGAMFASRKVSVDGHEMTFQVNHLAPFLLTNLLLDRLAASPDGARVVNTGSTVYRKAHLDLNDLDSSRGRYRTLRVYGASKLATIMFTRELARRTQGTAVTTSAFHPGSVATEVTRDNAWQRAIMNGPLGKAAKAMMLTPEQGAEPLLQLATTADPHSVNGAYFHRLAREDLKNAQASDTDLARRLWQRSAELTGMTTRVPARDDHA